MFLPVGDDQEHDRAPAVAVALIAINVAAFLALCLPEPKPWAMRELALVPSEPRPLALLGHMVLHGGWMHLGGNMLFLWVFGRLAEERLGHVGFAMFYLLSGAAAAALHAGTTAHPDAPMIGASGAVSGAIGAALALVPRAHIKVLYWFFFIGTFHLALGWWVAIWLAGQVYFASQGFGNVAYVAHLGGFGAGYAAAWAVAFFAELRRRRRAPAEARATEIRRPFAEVGTEPDPVFLDDTIDAFAVVMLGPADPARAAAAAAPATGRPPDEIERRLRATRGVALRGVPRTAADAARRELAAQGLAAALIADQAANLPPAPQAVESASWDDRRLRLRLGEQSISIGWRAPVVATALRLPDGPAIDLFLSRRVAYRIRVKPGLGLTRVSGRREEDVGLSALAQDLERYRESAGNDEGVHALASGGEPPSFPGPPDYEDYLLRVFHLAQAGHPVR